jgi:hypothetical protein
MLNMFMSSMENGGMCKVSGARFMEHTTRTERGLV